MAKVAAGREEFSQQFAVVDGEREGGDRLMGMLSQRRQEWASPIEEFSIGDSVDGWDAGMAMACRQGGRSGHP